MPHSGVMGRLLLWLGRDRVHWLQHGGFCQSLSLLKMQRACIHVQVQ